jgi:hypothetical protein
MRSDEAIGSCCVREAIVEGASNAEAEQIMAEGGSENESEEDNSILSPMKPSHIDFGEAESKLVRFTGEEVVPQPREDEVVFKSWAGLRFPLHDMIGEVLKNFEIYLHQLTPNAIVRLSVYIWALRSQGMSANGEAFCRVHELHYQTKARAYGLHKNFGCYNFAYRKDTKAPVIGYPLSGQLVGQANGFT